MLGLLLQIIQAMRVGEGARGVDVAEAGLSREIIGRGLSGDRGAVKTCLIRWLRLLDEGGDGPGGWLRLFGWGLLLLGLLLGLGVSGGLMAYSGERPVNVLPLIGFFVVLPLVLTGVMMVGVMTRAWWPSLPVLGDLAGLMSGARIRLVGWMLGRQKPLEGRANWVREIPGLGRVMHWQGLRWGLGLGLGFQLGGVLALTGAVVFSDVAFGWATTLEVSTESVSEWVATGASPWTWAWPEAGVSPELVALSRVYRGPGDVTGLGDLERDEALLLGGWWRFLLMAMLVYGLMPRVVAYGWVTWRLRSEALSVMVGLTGVRDVLLDLYEGGTRTSEDGVSANHVPGAASESVVDPFPAGVLFGLGVSADLVPWRTWLRSDWSGVQGTLDDEAVIASLRRADAGSGQADVLVVVRGWEPPMGDVLDDLASLRRSLGESGSRIVVVLLAAADGLPEAVVSDWRRAVSGIPGVAVVVKPGAQGVGDG
ncbi:DUF2868 domain-containing protein [Mucisphaera sp.]|uniref:DUF2868 domain-containing protein n=1 Tax=Mucisphaera sp. TaxID=2913024 RepID=UPI003D0D821C